MPTTLTLECGGCAATAPGSGPLRREFQGMFGGTSGFGSWRLVDPETLAPEGWVMFDPYTQCTYCPRCWAEIESGSESAAGVEV